MRPYNFTRLTPFRQASLRLNELRRQIQIQSYRSKNFERFAVGAALAIAQVFVHELDSGPNQLINESEARKPRRRIMIGNVLNK